jgi:hypothetical protein
MGCTQPLAEQVKLALFLGVKQPGSEAIPLSSQSVEVRLDLSSHCLPSLRVEQLQQFTLTFYRGADKSFARPGRKQATSMSKSS